MLLKACSRVHRDYCSPCPLDTSLLAYATILRTLLAAARRPDGHHDRRVFDGGRGEELQQRPYKCTTLKSQDMRSLSKPEPSLTGAFDKFNNPSS